MRITILTICPEAFVSFTDSHIVRRAGQLHAADIEIVDIRSFAGGSFRHIDDSPIGGGDGLLLRYPPMLKALQSVRGPGSCAVALTPTGRTYDQAMARDLAARDHLILLCGHYEGMDARILRHMDLELSIGDYVLSGGEIPAMAVADSLIRLQPGVLKSGSARCESYEDGRLEYPQYTQPADYEGERVPDILLSGNHEAIRLWRKRQALILTRQRRPDLLEKFPPDEEECAMMETAP